MKTFLILVSLVLLSACGREEVFVSVPTLSVNADGTTHCEPVGQPVCKPYEP